MNVKRAGAFPGCAGVTHSAAELHFALDEPSVVYYVVLVATEGATPPDVAAVVAGTVPDAIKKGWMRYDAATLAAGRERVVKVVGLKPLTAYAVHVAAKDVAEDNAQVTAVTLTLTTAQPTHDETLYRVGGGFDMARKAELVRPTSFETCSGLKIVCSKGLN